MIDTVRLRICGCSSCSVVAVVAWRGAGDATMARAKSKSACIQSVTTLLVGGDDNKEVDFNVYTAGGTSRTASTGASPSKAN